MFEIMKAVSTSAAAGAAESGKTPNQAADYAVKLFNSIDWSWVGAFALTAFLVFGCLVLAILFLKRWQVPRLGFFLFTAVNIGARIFRSSFIFWNVAAVIGAVAAVIFVISIHVGKNRHIDRKEPVYYLLNAVSLIILVFELNLYMITTSILCLFISLFFINTRGPSQHRGSLEADAAIMESLEKRARRRR